MIWTVGKLIDWTTNHFKEKSIPTARLDAELLLGKVLGLSRVQIYMNFERPVGPEELESFRGFVKRRQLFEPVAYILKEKEFYGRPFEVAPGALIPRPETEHLVDAALDWGKQKEKPLRILDVGTGSGCIAITLALELAGSSVWAVEKSKEALQVAERNLAKHAGVSESVNLVSGDFLEVALEGPFDLVVSNPPYVAKDLAATLAPDVVQYEPVEALFGGPRGDELLEPFLQKMASLLKPDGLLLCEVGFDQGKRVLEIAEQIKNLETFKVIRDYSGHDRLLWAQARG